VNIRCRSAGLKENMYTGHPFLESPTKALLRSPYIPEAKVMENNKEMVTFVPGGTGETMNMVSE